MTEMINGGSTMIRVEKVKNWSRKCQFGSEGVWDALQNIGEDECVVLDDFKGKGEDEVARLYNNLRAALKARLKREGLGRKISMRLDGEEVRVRWS